MKKNLLIITSLFPNKNNPIYGSFVYDQVILLKEKYNLKVFVEHKTNIGKRSFFKFLFFDINKLFNKKTYYKYSDSLDVYHIEYKSFSFLPPKIQYYYLVRFYRKTLLDVSKEHVWFPNIIHAHYLYNSGIIASGLNQKMDIPFVITEHNPINFYGENFWFNKAREAYLNSNKYCVVSHHEYRRMLTFDYGKNIDIVYNVVNEDDYTIKVKKSTGFIVLFVGYPHPLKGMKTLFNIIALFERHKVDGIFFNIISSDEKTSEFPDGISAFIKKEKIEKYCRLIPRQQKSQMMGYYNSSDVLLSTSINETFGLSQLEALLCGVPIVSTKSGGPDDFLTVENSLIYNIGDTEGLFYGIMQLKNGKIRFDPENVRNSVLGKFDETVFLEKIVSLYQDIFNSTI
ncbi:glycosyltransferase [Paludibacter sp. 221]|uniref:glycosyltransferase n=1 Tax=Paludibacter sp. 221 TaxID=2302939 RepID=UPI0013D60DE3|nr:glycosyltransferase [Paludibacter sp. 221]NDV46031.1 glycosyltransferase [Paludibacter sp. 221]